VIILAGILGYFADPFAVLIGVVIGLAVRPWRYVLFVSAIAGVLYALVAASSLAPSPFRTPLDDIFEGLGVVAWASVTFAVKSAFRRRPPNWTLIIILGLVVLAPLVALIAGFLEFGG